MVAMNRQGQLATGEFALLAQLAPYLTGAGDDAAVLDLNGTTIVWAADTIVRGRHWRDDLSSPADVGWKAIAVNVSDLAAMGAVEPRAALITLLLPSDEPPQMVEAMYEGMAEAAKVYGLELMGGDTTAAAELSLAVTVMGEAVQPVVWRSGAQVGDVVVVVGALGAAAAGLALHLGGHPAAEHLLAAHRRPQALLEAGRILATRGATAMLDVSDGLGQDLGHLCAASQVRAEIGWDELPIAPDVLAAAATLGVDEVALVCGGGEDYALVAALPPQHASAAMQAATRAEGVQAAVIGQIVAADPTKPLVGLQRDGILRDITQLGWDHFATPEEQ